MSLLADGVTRDRTRGPAALPLDARPWLFCPTGQRVSRPRLCVSLAGAPRAWVLLGPGCITARWTWGWGRRPLSCLVRVASASGVLRVACADPLHATAVPARTSHGLGVSAPRGRGFLEASPCRWRILSSFVSGRPAGLFPSWTFWLVLWLFRKGLCSEGASRTPSPGPSVGCVCRRPALDSAPLVLAAGPCIRPCARSVGGGGESPRAPRGALERPRVLSGGVGIRKAPRPCARGQPPARGPVLPRALACGRCVFPAASRTW